MTNLTMDAYQALSLVIDSLTAIGTVGAVVVSLYLARQDGRLRIRVRAGIRHVINVPGVDHTTPYLSITATNLGRRQATVTGFAWRRGLLPSWSPFLPRGYGIQLGGTSLSTEFPSSLTDGGEARLLVPLPEWLANEAPKILPHNSWLESHFVRIQVMTSTGHTFTERIPKALRQAMQTRSHSPIGFS